MNIIRTIKEKSDQIGLALFMAPMLAMLAIFVAGPTLMAIWFSFTSATIVLPGEFIGTKNFEKLLKDWLFSNSFIVTWEYVAWSLLWRISAALMMALLMNMKEIRFKGVVSAIMLLPWVIPGVTKPMLWLSLYEHQYGALNRILTAIGLPPQRWLYDIAMESLINVNVWMGIPFIMLVLTSAIASIPSDYYDAAEVSGATTWQKFRHVTLPLIKYPFVLCIILIVMGDLGDFSIPYILTEGGPNYRTELLSIFSYHRAFLYYQLGYGAAVAVILAIIVFIFGVGQLKLIGK